MKFPKEQFSVLLVEMLGYPLVAQFHPRPLGQPLIYEHVACTPMVCRAPDTGV